MGEPKYLDLNVDTVVQPCEILSLDQKQEKTLAKLDTLIEKLDKLADLLSQLK